MLNLILGRSGSGKTEELIKMMRGTENAIYIVPEQYSFAAEKKITHAFGVSGMGNPSVLSFRRLSHHMEERCGKTRDALITPSGRVMVMQKIVKNVSDKLTLFAGAARRGEMANESAVIATTFKQYSVTREKIENAMSKTKNSLLKKKLSDCLVISEEYEKFLEKGYRDSDDELEILRRNIEKDSSFSQKDIFIDSFTAFTPLEYSVIETMIKKCKSVSVSLSYGEGDEFETSKRSGARLVDIAKNAGVEIGKIVRLEGAMYASTDELKRLEKSFFENCPVQEEETKDIRLYRAEKESDEAVAAAREIERLCRDENFRYRDIVIVARDLSDYEKELTRAFKRFDIPLFIDGKTPLGKESAALFALSAIKIISQGWSNESVFGFMKTVFSPISLEESDELENYCLAAGVRRGDWRSGEKWSMKPSMNEDETTEEGYIDKINDIKDRLTRPLLSLEDKIKGRHSGREFAVAFYEFLEECRLEEKILSLSERMNDVGESETASRMKQVYRLLIETLESFEGAFSNEEINAGEFCEILSVGIENVEIGVIPSTTDVVCAGSIDRARGHGARAVIIIGANEGKFPAAPTDTGIFSDSDREELLQYNIELPPDTFGKVRMEQSLVYSALTCATDKLYVSCSMTRGEESYQIMRRIKTYFPNCVVLDEAAGLDEIDEISSAKSSYEPFVTRFAETKNGKKLGNVWGTALDFYQKDPFWRSRVEEIETHTKFENTTELIRRELLESRYGNEIRSSVSRLEGFVRCPFRYFASVTLSLRERKELSVTAADSGSFLHEFVDLFGKGLKDDGKTWRDIDDEYLDKKTEEISLNLLTGINRHLLETSPKTRYLFSNLKRIAKKSISVLSEHMKRGSFEPLGYEIVFDENGEFKPLKISLPNGKNAYLRGRVDRADVLDTLRGKFVRIIDYKSGDKKFSMNNVYYGLDLQLAIYLTTICENGGYRPGGMLYFKIDDPLVEGNPSMSAEDAYEKVSKTMRMDGLVLEDEEILLAMDSNYASSTDVISAKKLSGGGFGKNAQVARESDFKAMSNHVKRTVRELCGEILAGKNDVSPTKDACKYCEMKELCSFDATLKGCKRRNFPKLDDSEILLKMIQEEKEGEK